MRYRIELTLAETEKSIDLHKVSRGSGLTILNNSNPNLGENRNFEGILNPYKSRQYLQQARSRGDLLRSVLNIKNGVEIKSHCCIDSVGQI